MRPISIACAAVATLALAGAAWAQGGATRSGGPSGAPASWADRMMARADSDGDGRISAAEAQARRAQQFARIDANGDGVLAPDERAAKTARRGDRSDRLDADRDGQVTLADYTRPTLARFARMDADGDGYLTLAELGAARSGGVGD